MSAEQLTAVFSEGVSLITRNHVADTLLVLNELSLSQDRLNQQLSRISFAIDTMAMLQPPSLSVEQQRVLSGLTERVQRINTRVQALRTTVDAIEAHVQKSRGAGR